VLLTPAMQDTVYATRSGDCLSDSREQTPPRVMFAVAAREVHEALVGIVSTHTAMSLAASQTEPGCVFLLRATGLCRVWTLHGVWSSGWLPARARRETGGEASP
jgi:hypothetical protein